MGLDGTKMLQKMKRLSEAANMKQVKPLSYALFPGYHCPLMGAMLTIKEIDDSVMVVIGPTNVRTIPSLPRPAVL